MDKGSQALYSRCPFDFSVRLISPLADKNKTYIDVGAWIGPTVLYAAPQFKTVLCFEPDPVACKRLEENLRLNPEMTNVKLVKKGLYDLDGETYFGGTRELGNSESTFLVNFPFFPIVENVVTVQTTTLKTALKENSIDPTDIGLIKIDVEGGELVVIPAIASFLEKYAPPVYISLHHCHLTPEQISDILSVLFEIYPVCLEDGKRLVSQNQCESEKLSALVFTKFFK